MMELNGIYSPEYIGTIERALCIIYANAYRNQQIVMTNSEMHQKGTSGIIKNRIKNLDRQFNNWPMKELCKKHGIEI